VNVERRDSTGGPAPSEVSRMISDRLMKLESTRSRRALRLEKYDAARRETEEAMDGLLG